MALWVSDTLPSGIVGGRWVTASPSENTPGAEIICRARQLSERSIEGRQETAIFVKKPQYSGDTGNLELD